MEYIVKKILDKLEDIGAINKNKLELHEYVLLMKLEKYVVLLSVAILSIATDSIFETIIFMACFSAIRKRAGGYHASTFIKCYLLSIFIYLSFILKFLYIMMNNFVTTVIEYLVVTAAFMYIGAVNNPNIDWNDCELDESSKKLRQILMGILVLVVFASLFNRFKKYVCCAIFGVALSFILLLLGKISLNDKN